MENSSNLKASEQGASSWRSFYSLLALQTQNAFNDNMARFILVPLGAWLVAKGQGFDGLQQLLAGLMVLPYIFLASFAGWLGDRFSKARVIQISIWAQLAILAFMFFAMSVKSLTLAIFAFALLATQSAILSPSKMGIVKELVGSKKLTYASGLMEMFVILAILAGQIFSGLIFDGRLKSMEDGWLAAKTPIMILAIAGFVAVALSYGIRRTPAQATVPLSKDVFFGQKEQFKLLWENQSLRFAAIGVAFFWSFAGLLNLICIEAATFLTGGEAGMGRKLSWMMVAASGGIAGGSGLAGYLSRRGIELGLVGLGAILLPVFTWLMAFQPIGGLFFHVFLAIAGAGGAFIVVPLTALLQDDSPEDKRGAVIAASNLWNNLGGIAAVLFQLALHLMKVTVKMQLLICGLLGVVVSVYLLRLVIKPTIRFVGVKFLSLFYRVKTVDEDKLPAHGGVLLLPNHVTYMDAFILSMASPRPVRFVMVDRFFKKKWVKSFVSVFDTIPISSTKAKEAIMTASEAVKKGDVVCIFPEGQLTRTGMLNEIKKGFELIARRAEVPVMPVYMDGLWGSIFSYADGKFILKKPRYLPYRVQVAFGNVFPTEEVSAAKIREELTRLSSECFAVRDYGNSLRGNLAGQYLGNIKKADLDRTWDKLSEEEQDRAWFNAMQIADLHPVQEGETALLVADENVPVLILGYLLPLLARVRVDVIDAQSFADHKDRYLKGSVYKAILAGDSLEGVSVSSQNHFRFRSDLSEVPDGELTCLVKGDTILSASFPDPPKADVETFQPGNCDGSFGRVLPGFYTYQDGEQWNVEGPALAERYSLPPESEINREGFVVRRSIDE